MLVRGVLGASGHTAQSLNGKNKWMKAKGFHGMNSMYVIESIQNFMFSYTDKDPDPTADFDPTDWTPCLTYVGPVWQGPYDD